MILHQPSHKESKDITYYALNGSSSFTFGSYRAYALGANILYHKGLTRGRTLEGNEFGGTRVAGTPNHGSRFVGIRTWWFMGKRREAYEKFA